MEREIGCCDVCNDVNLDGVLLDSSGRDLHASFLSHIVHHLTYMTGLSDHMVC